MKEMEVDRCFTSGDYEDFIGEIRDISYWIEGHDDNVGES